jgi:uncharacterized protein YxjI
LIVQQKRELAELIGIETRNKYAIEAEDGAPIAYAAEQQKGILGILLRQILGHWRTFEIAFFGPDRQPLMTAVHPFRFFFQRLEVSTADGRSLGAIQQRFAFLHKKFDVQSSDGRVLMTVASPFWRIWTFAFERMGREVARIEKKWGGLLSEAFTDKDRFRVQFADSSVTGDERMLLLAAALFIDLVYFEKKAS